MNICLVSRELYPYQKAGIAVYIDNLAKCLSRNGHKVFIITDKHIGIENNKVIDNNITIISVSNDTILNVFQNYSLQYSYRVYLKIKDLIKREKIDIIEFSDYLGESYYTILHKKVIKELKDIPLVIKLHTPSFECNVLNGVNPCTNEITLQEDFCINNADNVYSISNAMKQLISRRLLIKNIEVVYNFIGLNKKFSSNSNYCSEEKNILYVGRIEKRKGVDLLVRAGVHILKTYDNVKFTFIGRDEFSYNDELSMKEYINSLIPNEIKHRFIFKDSMEREKLEFYYKNAYVSVFPSIWEGFGNVCLEAMAFGSPVIVSDAGGMMEIVENGKYGLFFKSQDNLDLISVLKKIITNNDLRDNYSKLSLTRSEFFNDDNLYPKQLSFYNGVISGYQNKLPIENESLNYLTKGYVEILNKLFANYAELIRVNGEWSILSQGYNNIKDELERVTSEWGNLANINANYSAEIKQKNLQLNLKDNYINELEFKLNELSEKIDSKKWLISKLFKLDKGEN